MPIFIRGIPRTRLALKKVEAELRLAAPAAARASAEVVAQAAQSRAPRNTGATAASIRVDSDGETAHVGPSTTYARFTEFGTIYIPAQRWLQDAADSSKTAIVTAQVAVLKAAVEGG